MTEDLRATTPEELSAWLLRTLSSLERALSVIEQGNGSGFDDAVRAIRLLALPGRGNDLLRRVANEIGVVIPELTVTQPAAPIPQIAEPLVFALGAMPADGIPVQPQSRRPRSQVSWESFVHMDVMYVDGSVAATGGSGTRVMSWENLLADLANKMGSSHADEATPKVFDEVCRYAVVDGVNPLALAVRSFGVALLAAGRAVTRSYATQPFEVPSLFFRDVWIGELHFYGHLGGLVRVWANVVTRKNLQPKISWRLERVTEWP